MGQMLVVVEVMGAGCSSWMVEELLDTRSLVRPAMIFQYTPLRTQFLDKYRIPYDSTGHSKGVEPLSQKLENSEPPMELPAEQTLVELAALVCWKIVSGIR